ncbi:hypothetical protein EZS27_023364 [termite gut metagenome]|uniref:ATP-binding protein n=1 Tax=termite gut metagenome TaxID=433724 RepID=A0A5J4R3X2_9ZZZZ
MNLREYISKIYSDNTDYSKPEHAINQAESLKSLSRDLYTDSKRFIYELLQNADDSAFPEKKVKVCIRFFDSQLVICHSGQPFSNRDLRGLCSVNDGTKKNSIEKTGYKGIGFKAVFGQSNRVIIFTNKEYFRFDENYPFEWKKSWGNSQQNWEHENDRVFSFPWQIIPIPTRIDEIKKNINEFLVFNNWNVATIISLQNKNTIFNAVTNLIKNVNMFLFLKNIEDIEFVTDRSYKITLNRNNNKISIEENGTPKVEWLSCSKKILIPNDVRLQIEKEQNLPDKLKDAPDIEITLAAKIRDKQLASLSSGEQLLYSYLPTDEKRYTLPVLVNTSFLTSANREALHENSAWNQWIFETIALELYQWIAELVKGEFEYQAYNLLPKKISIYDALSEKFNSGIEKALESIPFIISSTGELPKRDEAIVDFTFLSEKRFIGSEKIKENDYPLLHLN